MATSTIEQPINLTVTEAAARLRLAPGTMNNWRVQGVGPQWLKFGKKKVLYPLAEIIAFEQSRLRTSTKQTGEGA